MGRIWCSFVQQFKCFFNICLGCLFSFRQEGRHEKKMNIFHRSTLPFYLYLICFCVYFFCCVCFLQL